MFCERCGRNLSDGESYCPECGFPVRGDVLPPAYRQPVVRESDTLLTVASIAVMVYAGMALLTGLTMLTMGDTMISMIEQNPSVYEMFGLTAEDFRKLLPVAMVELLVSGVLAAVSSFFTMTRTNHRAAVLSCLAASLTLLVTMDIMLLAVGLLVTYCIHRSKAHFLS
ncbi:MAG: zinc ribbon domain-containing protein [Thermoplasmatales archaeon]|nr:zinc ribbon domain-containing protein [Thermoplasmatales archaeon]